MYGIRKKLIFLFIFLFTLVIICTDISYQLIQKELSKKEGYFQFNQVRILTADFMYVLEKGYQRLGFEDKLETDMNSLIDKIDSKVQVVSISGKLVYDSTEKNVIEKNYSKNIKTMINYDASFQLAHPGFIRFSLPVVVGQVHEADAVFVMPEKLISENNNENPWILMSPFIVGFICFILIFIYLVRKSLKEFIRPISRLTKAAMGIAKGNLEEKIDMSYENEVGVLAINFDLMREELHTALKKQEEMEYSKKELIASISHDLKTPMASIMLYVEGLEAGLAKDPETFQKYISVIRKKTDSVNKLIDDLFQHSLVDIGNFTVEKAEIYTRDLFKRILEPLKLQYETSNVKLLLEEPFPNVLINVDVKRIEQVILNLIQNSTKYTEMGGQIVFKASLEDEFVRVSIKDTGYGIEPEDMPYIFYSFYRGEKSRSRDFGGAGLGLSICKYIIEQHGGKIYADSVVGEGSEFIFTIPKI